MCKIVNKRMFLFFYFAYFGAHFAHGAGQTMRTRASEVLCSSCVFGYNIIPIENLGNVAL